MAALDLPAGIKACLDYWRERVSEEDIWAFIPNDPGSGGYFQTWNGIRVSGMVPCSYSFDLTEVFLSTGLTEPTEEADSLRFLRFRSFVHAVAIGHEALGGVLMDEWPLEIVVCQALRDILTQPPEALPLLYDALLTLRSVLELRGPTRECPFLTLGAIILAQRRGDFPASEQLAAELIAEERTSRPTLARDDRFMLSLTWDSAAQLGWMELARELQNPFQTPALATVIREMEESWIDP